MFDRLADRSWDDRIAEMVAEQAEQFNCVSFFLVSTPGSMLMIQTNLHLGFVYEPNWQFSNPSQFEPAYRRGARLSHAWVQGMDDGLVGLAQPVDFDYIRNELPQNKLSVWRYSTLDLVPAGTYVLFCSMSDNKGRWARLEESMKEKAMALRLLVVGEDFGWVDEEAGRAWREAYGIHLGGAVLVRPDQHVEAVLAGEQDIEEVIARIGRSLMDRS